MNIIRRSSAVFTIIAIALSVLAALPGQSQALSCMMPQYPEIARNGGLVVATVSNVEYSSTLDGIQTNRVTVAVERGWGAVQQTMSFMNPLRRVWTGTPEEGAPIPFTAGKRYVIALSYNQSGQLEAALGDCSSSFQITEQTQLDNFIAARAQEGMGQGTQFTTTPPSCTSDDCYPTTPQNYCPQLSTTFSRGARDTTTRPQGQVTELQRFLSDYYDIDESAIVSGYFGRNTHNYVVRFQREQNLPAYGIVGSMTRAKIASVCGGVISPPNPVPSPIGCTMEYAPVCGKPPIAFPVCAPNMSCPLGAPDTQPTTYSNRCMMKAANATYLYEGECTPQVACTAIGYPIPLCSEGSVPVETKNGQCPGPWKCVPVQGGAAPSISSFSGPTRLIVNETGTWKIIATDPNNGSLTYTIDWGERAMYASEVAGKSMFDMSTTQNTSFTHSYSNPGTYQVTITVRNQSGKISTASASVVVAGSMAGDTLEIARSPFDTSRVQIVGPSRLTSAIDRCVYSQGWFGRGGNGVSIDWGDGSQEITFNESGMGASCAEEQRTHRYTSPGTYTITARLWHPGPTDAPITDWSGTATITVGSVY